MAESLRSWLWEFASKQALEAYHGGYDAHDMPFLRGNRVQILRFMTFPVPNEPTEIWALVGDRTHCVAVVFHPQCVVDFERQFPMTLTSLKGALITLSQVKLSVGPVHTQNSSQVGATAHDRGLVYRHLQPALFLKVSGFQVVSSVSEPIWFTQIHLITSNTGISKQAMPNHDLMIKWVKQEIRHQNLCRRSDAVQQREREHTAMRADSAKSIDEDNYGKLPTPGQRKGVVRSRPLSSRPERMLDMDPPDQSISSQAQPRIHNATVDTTAHHTSMERISDEEPAAQTEEVFPSSSQPSSQSLFARVYDAVAKSISSTPSSPTKRSSPPLSTVSSPPPPAPITASKPAAPAPAPAAAKRTKRKRSGVSEAEMQARRDRFTANLLARMADTT